MSFVVVSHPVSVFGKSKIEYFGIGAEIKKIEGTTFQVSPQGQGRNEGFGISSIKAEGGKQITFQSNIKGDGRVYVKISETNENGEVIKESISKPIELTSSWDMNRSSTKLAPSTSQINIQIITDEKQTQIFYIKNIRIHKEKQPAL
jgi:hypothetical protein